MYKGRRLFLLEFIRSRLIWSHPHIISENHPEYPTHKTVDHVSLLTLEFCGCFSALRKTAPDSSS
jgi:hypothetical protein